MAEQAVYSQLATIPALGSRVYPLVLPQNVVYPAVVYQRISANRYYTFGRGSRQVEPTIQVDLYASKADGYAAFGGLAETVLSALEGIAETFIDNERDDFEDDTNLYRKSYDAKVWYLEA